MTPEIAAIRNKPLGQDVISPSRFPGIDTKEDLKALVDRLRLVSGGRPIGIKIAAGRIEKDLEFCVYAGPDFITIDGREGNRSQPQDYQGFHQRTHDLRPLQGQEIPGPGRLRGPAGDNGRPAGIF